MLKYNANYIPLYGHQQPLSSPPKVVPLKTLTMAEIELFHNRYTQIVRGHSPYDVSHLTYKALKLPLPLRKPDNGRIIRPPTLGFGHHNQVIDTLKADALQNSTSTQEIYYTRHYYNPRPRSRHTVSAAQFIEVCLYRKIPIEAGLRFLVWEFRRVLGKLPFTLGELEEECSVYLDFEPWRYRFSKVEFTRTPNQQWLEDETN